MDEVTVGDLTVKPSLEKTIKNIHPAIGVVDNTAYVGVWIPCEIAGKKGGVTYKDLLFLVTDKRELILANDDVFREKGLDWRLVYKPIRFPNRWRLSDVEAFLHGASVNPAKVLDDLVSAWKKYMELPNGREIVYHALWDLETYLHILFNAFPYHYVGGIKRSGKTKDLTLHYCLAFNAIFSNNMSTACIYRLIQNAHTTLLIDETEKLSYKGKMSERGLEFRSLLLAGYKKGGMAYRVVKSRKDQLRPQGFSVYGPKALANIRGLEDVIEDRCKTTILRRSRTPKIMNLEVDINSEEWSELRNELYVFFLTFWREIKQIYDEISKFSELSEAVNTESDTLFSQKDLDLLVGRELELWKPILALTLFLDKKGVSVSTFTDTPRSLTSCILRLAVDDAKQRQIENMTETGEVILVQVLQGLIEKDDYYKVKEIKEEMVNQFDEEQKWLTSRWVGSALRRLGFKEKRRVGTGYEYLFHVADVQELARRMQLPEIKPTIGDKIAELKNWIIENKEQGLVVAETITNECGKLGLDPQKTIEKLWKKDGFLFKVRETGKFGVTK